MKCTYFFAGIVIVAPVAVMLLLRLFGGDGWRALCAITQPLLVVVGTDDEAFLPDPFEPVISQYSEGQVERLDGVSHMGAVVDPKVRPVVKAWLEQLGQ